MSNYCICSIVYFYLYDFLTVGRGPSLLVLFIYLFFFNVYLLYSIFNSCNSIVISTLFLFPLSSFFLPF